MNVYNPTENEIEAIDRAGLNAAWRELQTLDNDNEQDVHGMVLSFLRAFNVANIEIRKARSSLVEKHPEVDYVDGHHSATLAVCSAFMGLLIESPDEIHPTSVNGLQCSALLQAAIAISAMSSIDSALDDEAELFGTEYAGDILDFAKKEQQ